MPDKSGTTDILPAVPMSADLLAVFAILGVGSVLGGFRLFARLRLGAFARRGGLSAVCSGFGVFHVHSFWGIAPYSDFCLSRVVCRTVCDFILFRAGEFPSLHFCEGVTPSRSHAFHYKSVPSIAALPAMLGARSQKQGGEGHNAPRGVQIPAKGEKLAMCNFSAAYRCLRARV